MVAVSDEVAPPSGQVIDCLNAREATEPIKSRGISCDLGLLPFRRMSEPHEFWRVFIAIELPLEIRKRITEHIDLLRHEFFDVRASWNREANLHLSLKFLGNIPVANIGVLSNATAVAVRTVNPFGLIISGCGVFPAHGRPNVLWIGIDDPSQNLRRLYATLEDRCAEAGFEREARAYHPHLTIARMRSPRGARDLAQRHKEMDFSPVTFTVSELVIFRSELRSEGSLHTAISRHDLR